MTQLAEQWEQNDGDDEFERTSVKHFQTLPLALASQHKDKSRKKTNPGKTIFNGCSTVLKTLVDFLM